MIIRQAHLIELRRLIEEGLQSEEESFILQAMQMMLREELDVGGHRGGRFRAKGKF